MGVYLYELGTTKYVREASHLHQQESNNTQTTDEEVRRKETGIAPLCNQRKG